MFNYILEKFLYQQMEDLWVYIEFWVGYEWQCLGWGVGFWIKFVFLENVLKDK